MKDDTSHTPPATQLNMTSTTSRISVPNIFRKDRMGTRKHRKIKTLNNTPVKRNGY